MTAEIDLEELEIYIFEAQEWNKVRFNGSTSMPAFLPMISVDPATVLNLINRTKRDEQEIGRLQFALADEETSKESWKRSSDFHNIRSRDLSETELAREERRDQYLETLISLLDIIPIIAHALKTEEVYIAEEHALNIIHDVLDVR